MSNTAIRRRSRVSEWWWELTYRVGPNLWVIPLMMGLLSVLLFVVTRRLDRVVDAPRDHHDVWIPEWLIARTGADAAVVLTAFLGALATALALVFSTTVLTFSLASSQLGPRLIRRFMEDPVTQVTLGLFLSTVIFCALTLGSVRTGIGAAGVPAVSFGVVMVLGMSCFVGLVIYIHRVATTIQSPNVVASVVQALDRSLDERAAMLEGAEFSRDDAAVAELRRSTRSEGKVVVSHATGFVQGIDHLRLLDAVDVHDASVVMEHRVGQFVVEGQPLAWVAPAAAVEALAGELHHSVEIGPWRTQRQDAEYAIYQVVEIAIRALSPAVNDTFTGMVCVDWLGAALCRMGREPVLNGGLLDGDGRTRLYLPPLRFERAVRAAFDLIRQAGAGNPAISIRLLDVIATTAVDVRPEYRSALRSAADQVLAGALAESPIGQDEQDLLDRHGFAVRTLEILDTGDTEGSTTDRPPVGPPTGGQAASGDR